jgi:hypothetical protein
MPLHTRPLISAAASVVIDMTDADDIVAVCKRGAKRQKIPVLDLALPSPPPKGAEWIAAYRHWRKGFR